MRRSFMLYFAALGLSSSLYKVKTSGCMDDRLYSKICPFTSRIHTHNYFKNCVRNIKYNDDRRHYNIFPRKH